MGSLVRSISGVSGVGYGVNVWEIPPVAGIRGASTNVVGMVGLFPWGPQNQIVTVTTPAEFFATFYPDALGGTKDSTTYPAIRALLNKPLFTRGGLKVVRPAAGSSAAASSGSITAGTGSVTITAKYKGALGNSIRYQFTAATNANAAQRNVVITTTHGYSATYENITFAAVDDIVDPLVTITASAPSAMPDAGSATALTSGSDGTPAAGDFSGAGEGITLFAGDGVDVDVLFVAECPSGLIDDVNDALLAFAGEDKGIVVLCTPAAQSSSTAITYVADYRDDRVVYTWPRVKTVDFFDADQDEVTVDGNAFAAAVIANVDPWLSPGGAGKNQGGVDLLRGISGLENESTSRTTLDSLNDAGVAPWAIVSSLGVILRRAVTTASSGRTKVFSRRMTDYLSESISTFMEQFVERPLDVDLTNQDLGTITGACVSAIRSFLDGEQANERIRGSSVDAFTANTQDDIDAGRWTILIAVKLVSMAEEIVLKVSIGETVTIQAA